MGGFEWNCRNCTYHHKSHATRCQMCNELRVSREEMRSFVTGGNAGNGSGNASNSGNDGASNAQGGASVMPSAPASISASGSNTVPGAAGAAAGGPVNPYLASGSTSRRPMTANNNANSGAGGVLNPYASNANANANTTSNATAGTSSSGGGRPTNNSIGGAGAGSGSSRSNNANGAMVSGSSMQHHQQQQRPASGHPHNPYGQQRGGTSSASGAIGGAAANSNNHNHNHHLNMNPPPPRQPAVQQQQRQMNQQGRMVASATNNPYHNQNRGPANPYAQQQSMNTTNHSRNNNSTNRRTLPPPPQQQRQSMGPGVAAMLADSRSRPGGGAKQQQQPQRQNPWTVAEANAATKQSLQYRPGPVPLDEEAVKTWFYPDNPTHRPREYQLKATEDAIMHNTLVSLPTGLGKTLIAAVTMYNFYRWFPTGKVVFCAPTKPLVSQQITSCYEIMGVPAEHTAEIMGETTNKEDRARYWTERRLFFCTPQTIGNDIDAGRCDPKSIVCVVIDEAHRAKGKYAYVKLVQKITQSGAKFRVVSGHLTRESSRSIALLYIYFDLTYFSLSSICCGLTYIVCAFTFPPHAARTQCYAWNDAEGYRRSR